MRPAVVPAAYFPQPIIQALPQQPWFRTLSSFNPGNTFRLRNSTNQTTAHRASTNSKVPEYPKNPAAQTAFQAAPQSKGPVQPSRNPAASIRRSMTCLAPPVILS